MSRNPHVERAMRAAFEAWRQDVARQGKIQLAQAKFDHIGKEQLRGIELQARAAIASLKELPDNILLAGAEKLPDYEPGTSDAKACLGAIIDAALKD